MLSDTEIQALQLKGYLYASGRIRRTDIARDLATLLRARYVIDTIADVDTNVGILDELATSLFGTSSPGLRTLVAQLTSIGPGSPVQRALENGYVLCATPVQRVVGQVDGQAIMRRFSGRFLSDAPDVVTQYALEPIIPMVEQAMVRARARAELVERRVPALAAQVRGTLQRAAGNARLALGAATPQQ